MKKDLKYYMNLPYTIIVKKDETGDYVASYADLPFCDGVGNTPAEAIKELEINKRLKIQSSLEDGFPIPEPKRIKAASLNVVKKDLPGKKEKVLK
jgi:predicted RNase H-like HicB family nuclease